jgi:hypothetical protein
MYRGLGALPHKPQVNSANALPKLPAHSPHKSQSQNFRREVGTRLTLAYNPNSRHSTHQKPRDRPAVPVSPYNVSKLKDPAHKAGCLCRSVVMENTMLSPHEFATLLLVQEAPNQVDMQREELDALLERQLVQLENLASGRQQWRLTESGDSTVKAFKRFS